MAKPGKKGKKGKKGKSALYQPNKPLSGKPFKKTVNALTNIETRPAINAQKNLIQSINRGFRRDDAALGAMGQRLDTSMEGMIGKMREYGQESVAQQEANRDALRSRLTNNATSAQDSLNQLQSSVLGDQISTLASQQVAAGSSGSQGRLAQLAEMQQQANATNSQASRTLGDVIGYANVDTAAAQRDASLYGAERQKASNALMVESRRNEARGDAAEARRAAQTELATLRSLRGSTKLKNALDLRREQQQFQLGRAELAQAGAQSRAELGIKNRELDIKQQLANQDGQGGGGGGGKKGERRLSGAEYQQAEAAALEKLGGGKIGNYGQFLSDLQKVEGFNLTPVERRKFRRRFKKKNPGLFG
jgi:hypothetical protein